MARLSGQGGAVIIGTGTVTVAGIKSWKLTHTVKTEPTTGFDSGGWEDNAIAIQSWGGSFEGFKDGAPLALNTTTTIQLLESTTTGQRATGTGIITNYNETVNVDGIITVTYDFVGKGTLTTATA